MARDFVCKCNYRYEDLCVTTPTVKDKSLSPAEIWLQPECIKACTSVAAMVADYATLKKISQKINIVYASNC